MTDDEKSRAQLLEEIKVLRGQLTEFDLVKSRLADSEQALLVTEGNLKTFMENARGFGVYSVEPDEREKYGTRNIFISPSIKDILGIETPENNASWFVNIHPDDAEHVTAAHLRALTETSEFEVTMRCYHPVRKEWRWMHAMSSVVKVGSESSPRFNGMIVDITDIKRAEEVLLKSNEELEMRVVERTAELAQANVSLRKEVAERKLAEAALLKSQEQLQRYITAIDDIGIGLSVIDGDYNVRTMNGTLAAWFGEIGGRKCYDLLMGRKEPCPDCRLEDMGREGRTERYHPVMDDGRSYEIVATPISASDGGTDRMVIVRDITEQKAQEERRLKMSQQQEQLKKLNSLKTMAGAIAHRFNNAMTGVQGNLELLTSHLAEGAREQKMASSALQAARGASRIGSMMLSYLGQKPLQLEEISLPGLIEEAVMAQRVELPPSITIDFQPPGRALNCLADATQITDVLKSIFSNSVESLTDRSGTISVSFGSEEMRKEALPLFFQGGDIAAGELIYCQIEDSGHGMNVDDLEQIFDPFYTTRSTGRGLGLALAAGIMQTHRGALAVESSPGQGTRVKMLLPIASISTGQRLGPAADSSAGGVALGGDILLADDEPIILICLKMMLEDLGFTVHTAENGREALEMISTGGVIFRAVVMDILMPGMNGIEATEEIKKITPHLPVLLISGYSAGEFPMQNNLGDAFLVKPVNQADIRSKLESLL